MEEITKPKQAVILAGGKGTRLLPITNNKPKPMIEFHGKVFLEYLIEMLREQGFKRILLLLGYLPELIQDYFGDGSKWDIEIKYSVTDVENNTGRRIKLAENLIDSVFLLMYCDNYWPVQIDKMWRQFVSANVSALVTVYLNKDHYTKDNLRVDEHGYVEIYDKSRTAPKLQGVDIGFLILRKDVLGLLPEQGNASFEEAVYHELIKNKQLKAYLTEHRYYSVGSHDRLNLTNEFLLRKPTVILDRDGVLNKNPPKAQYVCRWDDWEWIVVTNQAGIARGFMTESDLEIIHEKMQKELFQCGGSVDRIYYCPHGWNDNCECRKPKPGMFFQAQRDFNLDLSLTFFVGDDERDRQVGDAAECKTLLVDSESSLLKVVKEKILSNSS
ncbi:MAG: HAD-IIIA family hydrolase [Planctomycetota bacterium]|jgi:D-glycero-D-manno-heptose 1,7-bisphosphate phosphatase